MNASDADTGMGSTPAGRRSGLWLATQEAFVVFSFPENLILMKGASDGPDSNR